jgi:carbon monoxide dehydrogenase subunit G
MLKFLGSRGTAAAVAALGVVLSTSALAHGPTRQKVVETISIDAPAAVVWARIKNFDALKDWHPAVAESPADKGNDIGSVRTVKLKEGGMLSESLEKYSDEQMSYHYRAKDGGALPVSNYTSTLKVVADGDKSTVEWQGAFYRAYPNNDPPPDKNDEAAVAAVTAVYKAGLANLKKLVETK